MKRSVLTALISIMLLLGSINLVSAQEQPAPKKDTVNMDTNAKPEFYYEVEDEESMEKKESGNSTIIIIAAAVVVIGGATLFLLKRKK